jgi:GTP 3',8-cyclase
MKRTPTYLRIVATAVCNMSCSYCHMEGDPRRAGASAELDGERLRDCLRVAARVGVRKFKFLGGEPFLRRDLAETVRALRESAPEADISAITAAAVQVERLDAALEAGLDRVNVTVHGFTEAAFSLRSRNPRLREHRQRFVDAILAHGRPVKINYVYGGPSDRDDLAALLDWAAERSLLVNVLDDLDTELGYVGVAEVVRSLRGVPERVYEFDDPHSLPTLRWAYAGGLVVELKHQRLGDTAPWSACVACPKREGCKEGIFALRLTHRGQLQACMDRPDLSLDLAAVVERGGVEAGVDAWQRWTASL